MAESVLKALKLRYNGRGSSQQITHEIAQNSMELMRLNVQELFDKEIELIVQKYTEVCLLSLRVLIEISHCDCELYFLIITDLL